MKKLLRRFFPGVSWQYPFVNTILKILDPLDFLIRYTRGLHYLPKYSVRVRSNGINNQFGGKAFNSLGQTLVAILQTRAGLVKTSKVLEIGCGCGRSAFAMANIIAEGSYLGIDIDKPSINSCNENQYFIDKNFDFKFLDIKNDEYNPDGQYPANEYKFPYQNAEYDLVFLVSVFTHMLTDDVSNYISEISRVLKEDGICMVTTFLMDKGTKWDTFSFIMKEKEHYFFNQTIPEVAVGYDLNFYIDQFSEHDLKLQAVEWGSWRKSDVVKSSSGFSQDIIFFKK
jgi:SAM-dependent methyltransferase